MEDLNNNELPVSDIGDPSPISIDGDAVLIDIEQTNQIVEPDSLAEAMDESEEIGFSYKLDYPIFNDKIVGRGVNLSPISLPYVDGEELETRLKNVDSFDARHSDTPEATAITRNVRSLPIDNRFLIKRARKDRKAKWSQSPKGSKENTVLGITNNTLRLNRGELVDGDKAVMAARRAIGLSATVTIPLCHSGFNIKIKDPGEAELIRLEHLLSAEKIDLARRTHGFSYSNLGAAFTRIMVDFIVRHVYSTSLAEQLTYTQLLEKISVLDYPILVWGLACAVYPNGFPYKRAVIDPEGRQRKDSDPITPLIIQGNLNVSKCLWIDTNLLNDFQINLLDQNQKTKISEQSLDLFRQNATVGLPEKVVINDAITVELSIPNMATHLEVSGGWVDSITHMIDNIFQVDKENDNRELLISDVVSSQKLRSWGSYISKIEMNTGGVIDNRSAIGDVLTVWSSDDDVANTIIEKVKEYIARSTVAMIGVVRYSTTEEKAKAPEGFEQIVPLDPLTVFFILQNHTIQRIRNQ